MRFLIGFVSGIVAVVALGRSMSVRRPRFAVPSPRPAQLAVSRNLARYYRVSLN